MGAQSEYVHVAHTFSHVLVPTCMLSRCLVTKISAPELSQKLIKSALLVGYGYFQVLLCYTKNHPIISRLNQIIIQRNLYREEKGEGERERGEGDTEEEEAGYFMIPISNG